jgi:predicted metalloprotease
MRWRPGRRSADVEDRRSAGGGVGGGGLPFPIPLGRVGGGGIGTIVVLVIVYLLFVKGGDGGGFNVPDPTAAFPQVPQSGTGNGSVPKGPDPDSEEVDFVSFVLDDAQAFWRQQFQAAGKPYQRAKLVLFRNRVSSGCGLASSATGPFYCPLDQKVYIDLGFFDELTRRFQAPGDFAQAYVLAHETYDRGILETGDLQEGLGAAAAVGDDRIQSQAQGRIDSENFTHGTSEQRARWLQTGFDSGKLDSCDTFSGDI